MLSRIFRLMPVAVGLILLASCAPYRDIEVNDFTIDHVSMQGSRILINFSAMVNNPNRAFVLHSAGGDLNLGEKAFANAELLKSIIIPAKSNERCSGQLQLTIQDLMAALQMGLDAKSWDLNALIFNGDLQVRAAWLKKKFRYNNVPLAQLIHAFQ
jgi:LEA14-like dessication related protein